MEALPLRHAALIRPTLLVVLIQLTLLYFNMVTLVFTLTGGGPLAATDTPLRCEIAYMEPAAPGS
jgi:hypothetical protein